MILCIYEDDSLFIHHSVDQRPDPKQFAMHVHPRCELYYFISGKGYHSVEGSKYELTPGTILIMRSAETHMLHIDPSMPYERFIVQFYPEDLEGTSPAILSLIENRELGKGNSINCNKETQKFISECYKRIHRAIVDNAPKYEIISYFMPILYELAYSSKDSDQTQISYKSNTDKLVSDIISYINMNLTEIKSMEFIEQNFYFSRSYLNRIFKRSTGSTIWDYVIVKRLMLARTLIEAGELASSASIKSGFSDYSSFYRLYKKRFGVAPSVSK